MGFSNENLVVVLTSVELDAFVSDFTGAMDLVSVEVSALAVQGGVPWDTSLELASITLAGGPDFGWDVSLDVASVTLDGSGNTGFSGDGAITLPGVSLSASMQTSGALNKDLVSVTISAIASTVIDWGDISLALPAAILSATGSATLEAEFQAWCMNAQTTGVTEYTSFPMTSMARFNGKYYGTIAAGIYELAGDDDAGVAVDAVILGGVTDYSYDEERGDASMRNKRSGGAYVNLRAKGEFIVVAVVDEDKERLYCLDATGDPTGMHARRVNLGRRLEGRNWQFGFQNVDGDDFLLRDFQNIPIFDSRRI